MARPQTISDAEILRAAREVFLAHGPGVSVGMIAQRLGVSHAALFARVGSKEALMRRALSPEAPWALSALAEAPPDTEAGPRLVAILMGLMAFFEQVLPGLVVLKASGAPMGGVEVGAPVLVRRALSAWLLRAPDLEVGSPDRAEALAEALLGAMEARCFNRYVGGVGCVLGEDLDFIGGLVAQLVLPPRPVRPHPSAGDETDKGGPYGP